MENDYSPAQALADAEAARHAAAARVVTPWWYHPLLGVSVASLVMSVGPSPDRLRPALLVAAMAIMLTIVTAYRRLYGVWVGPAQVTTPRSRWAYASYALLVVVCVGVGYWTGSEGQPAWPGWVAAAAGFVGTIVIGRWLDERLRQDIRAGGASVEVLR